MKRQHLLVGYSTFLTGAVAITLLTAAARAPTKATFAEIDVQRINVREPDGTLRMTISGRDRLPPIIIRGKEVPTQPRAHAGVIFFNDEGSETGGLIFNGRDKDGKATSSGSLTFDRHEQDQVIQILENEDGERRFAGLLISDRPNGRLDFQAMDKARQLKTPKERRAAFAAANAGEAHRVIVARDPDKSAQVGLKDGRGRTRILLRVADTGESSIHFLDEAGKVVKAITPN